MTFLNGKLQIKRRFTAVNIRFRKDLKRSDNILGRFLLLPFPVVQKSPIDDDNKGSQDGKAVHMGPEIDNIMPYDDFKCG